MNRREAIRLIAAAGAGVVLVPWSRGIAKVQGPGSAPYPDLVAVKDGSPVQMFDQGIRFLGGIGRFVRKGQTVAVKPNLGWAKTPVEGATTNPELVGRIVKASFEAGAKSVVCFDHSVHVEKNCWERSGIAKAVRENGGEMRTADDEKDYREVKLERAKILKTLKVHKLYLDSDVVINVPILKSHGGSRITCAIKNLMGVVWDRRVWHREGLHQAIGEFCLVRKPDLNVVDAYIVMRENGPLGSSTEDLLLKRMQILSADIVLADTAAVKTLEVDPARVPYLKTASELGLGKTDLDGAKIKRVTVAG